MDAAHRPLDDEDVAHLLQVIAYPARLELLSQLRKPRALADIEMAARRAGGGVEHERKASKQTIHEHLKKLEATGLVQADRADGRVSYTANPVLLYGVIQRLRNALVQAWGPTAGADQTMLFDQPLRSKRPDGPHLVLVHGIEEGRCWSLEEGGPWTLGRGEDVHVALDYDLYVSRRAADIVSDGGRFLVRDLGSTSGVNVNWSPVEAGGEIELHPGDVIGAGGSLLLFRSARS